MPRPKYTQRLEPKPTELIDRSKAVTLEFDGASIRCYEGDTVASALSAAGVRTLSRGFKYHRPRGLLCVAGRCPNCLVTVDDAPNVRACTEQVRDGMKVHHQNAWPSLNRDFLSILDHLHWLMPVGFYYKALHRPKLLWKLAQQVISRVAGLGRVDINAVPDVHFHHQNQHTDVAVIGGGPAGLSAALAAAEQGAEVVLVDDQPTLGGHLRFDQRPYSGVPGFGTAAGVKISKQLVEKVLSSDGIQVLSSATAFGLYQDRLLGILQADRLIKLRAKQMVIATGSYEVPLIFEQNDLPGVMLTTGAQRLMLLYGVQPGKAAVVATSNDQGYYAAQDLLDAGIEVTAIVDLRPQSSSNLDVSVTLKERGVEILTSHAVVRADGKSRVTAAVVAGLDNGAPSGAERRLKCDLICMSGGFRPADPLLYQAGCGLHYDETLKESIPSQLPPDIQAAGEVTGIHALPASLLQGTVAGKQAAAGLATPIGDHGNDLEQPVKDVALAEEE